MTFPTTHSSGKSYATYGIGKDYKIGDRVIINEPDHWAYGQTGIIYSSSFYVTYGIDIGNCRFLIAEEDLRELNGLEKILYEI